GRRIRGHPGPADDGSELPDCLRGCRSRHCPFAGSSRVATACCGMAGISIVIRIQRRNAPCWTSLALSPTCTFGGSHPAVGWAESAPFADEAPRGGSVWLGFAKKPLSPTCRQALRTFARRI